MTPPHPRISIIMINRNGGPYLEPALATCRIAIEEALGLEPRIEFLLVDNGSTDGPLPTVGRQLANAPFTWHVVQEPRPGVNAARNAGVSAASGDLVFLVDSDLEFEPWWLRSFVLAARQYPAARVFGGRVRVGKLEAPLPSWLPVEGPFVRSAVLGRCDYGDSIMPLPIDDQRGPVGTNMGFRRDVFTQFGMFDSRFGLRPGSFVPGAESEFFDRLARAGITFLYVPEAVVDHPVKKSQMTQRYFKQRLHGIGRATSRLRRLRGERPRQVCGLTLYMMRQLAASVGRWMMACVTLGGPVRQFHARGDIEIALGYLHEDFIAWRGPKRTPPPQPADAL
jgi:glycosyltransferase involved in cell wall biosynthesis